MSDKMHDGLPVHGYKAQDDTRVRLVNENKIAEEQLLRLLDDMKAKPDEFDQRWLALARTQIEIGFMSLNRAIFRPSRIDLPEDFAKAQNVSVQP